MEPFFSEFHASAASQLNGKPCRLRQSAASFDGWMKLGKSLSHELRYLEAIEAYSQAILLEPNRMDALRQRGGKYLATLQPEKAMADFERCRMLGGEESDLSYRMGLCWFYAGVYGMAIREFSHCWEVCDDELGIGAIYWSMIASWRSGREASLLQNYRDDMNVGHHTAYAFAVRVALGRISLEDALWELDIEREDLEFSMMAYGVAAYCEHIGERETAQVLYREILERESFWISFGFLAAWNDRKRGRQC